MPRVKVAHIREQGQAMIIVPLAATFGAKSRSEKKQIVSKLRSLADGAGLAGEVVPVWDNGEGRMGFIAPTPWHPFFKSINLQLVNKNLNKELYWPE
jgi:hypothetical protein